VAVSRKTLIPEVRSWASPFTTMKENTLKTKLSIAVAALPSWAAGLASNTKATRSAWALATTVVAMLATPLSAQDNKQQSEPKHHHYKLIDLGTFGGPQSFVLFPDDGSYARVLNNSGTVAGWADTAVSDPHPNFCFTFVDCHVEHAFLSKGMGKTNLGSLPAPIPTSSQPNWIAQNGYAAGFSENGELDPLVLDPSGSPVAEFRAVFWGEDGIVDLGTPPQGGYESVANAVNDRGQVVGSFTNTIPDANSIFGLGYQTRAFIWKGGIMQDLGTLGGTDAQAMLINDRGQVVGESYLNANPSPACALPLVTGAFLWENGEMQNLGSLGGTCTLPSDLNERGQIVGVSNLPNDQNAHAFLWENGTMKDLGNTFGGASSSAIAINHAGHVVGSGQPTGDNSPLHASLWKNGVQTDLGAFGTDCAFAVTINSKDQIAGASYPRAGATYPNCNYDLPARGFLYENGELVDLNNLVPPESNLHISEPETINDRGEIAGLGIDASGSSRAFLLIPCDEHHPEVDGCDYDMVDSDTAAQVRPSQITGSSVAASDGKLAQANRMTRYRSALTHRTQRVRSLAAQ
jgi:probable HAF family extracellular repeat protein